MKLRLPLILQAALLSALAFTLPHVHAFSNGDEVVTGKTSYSDGGVKFSNTVDILYNDYNSILFSNNKASRYGGVLSTDGPNILFTANGDISFLDNSTGTSGGALYAYDGSIELTGNQNILFSGNKVTGTLGTSAGGAIFADSYNLPFSITENKNVTFTNNEAYHQGGAIATSLYITRFDISDNEVVTFDKNKITNDQVTASGGAIYSQRAYVSLNNNKELNFTDNTTKGIAGAIYSFAGLEISGNDKVLFSGNTAKQSASAIASGYYLNIVDNGEVLFTGNRTDGEGAALYFTMQTVMGIPGANTLSADRGDITFDGNLRNVNAAGKEASRLGMVGAVANKQQANVTLQARDGYSINFYDAFYLAKLLNNSGSTEDSSLNLYLNSNEGCTGNILISGEKNNGEVLESFVSGDTNLYQGTLIIRDNAKLNLSEIHSTNFGAAFTETDIRHNLTASGESTIEMTGKGALAAKDVSLVGTTVLRTGTGATMDVDKITMNHGVTFDLAPFLGASGYVSGKDGLGNDVNGDSGVSISANSWELSGNGTLRLDNTLDFNGDDRWASDRRFLLLVDANGSRGEADFQKIVSLATGTDTIGEGFAYKGNWTYEWVGDSLYAVWLREEIPGGELWWDGEGAGNGNGIGTWNQDTNNKVWNLDAPDGPDFGFQDLDIVHFTRSGTVNIEGFVEVNGNVRPSGVIEVHFNDGKGELYWQGPGSIVGRASLEKYGTGVLVIRTENSFSGGTQMYGGIIRVESLTGLGRGDVTLHGGLIDLGQKGVSNNITVVGNGALAGTAEGEVLVKENATLNFLGGLTYTAGLDSASYIDKVVSVEDKGTVNILAGSTVNSLIQLNGAGAALNLVAGNGGTSLFNGAVLGNGTLNVIDGKHQIKEASAEYGDDFDGTVNIKGGELTISSDVNYKDVVMTGGTLVADSHIIFDSLVVGSGNLEGTHEKTTAKILPGSDNHNVFLGAKDIVINGNSTFAVDGIFNALGETHVRAGGNITVNAHSRAISWGMVYDEISADKKTSSRIDLVDNTSIWNANGGFEVHYIDARTGTLTIGSDSVIKENGFFRAENLVYGTDKDGNILDIGTAAENTPTLTISKGSTFWAGNTTQVKNDANEWVYQTQTGFQCVQLDIEALVTIGTFVVQGESNNAMTHTGILESMEKAFTPMFDDDGKDPRFYLYVLKENVRYSADNILSNETVHVDTGADALIENTSGTILNIDGKLQVNGINAETGSVTAAGGYTNLTQATPDSGTIHFIGSYTTEAPPKDTKEAEIRLIENTPYAYTVVVNTVQAWIGGTTKIAANSEVQAQNFIISGDKTVLDNEKGKLTVDKEVTLAETATYKVGKLDRFGWVNMNEGNLNLTQSAWDAITLGSYAETTTETAAKVRLNEGKANNVDAKELTVVTGNEHTLVTEGNIVSTDKLTAGKESFLDVQGGTVKVRSSLLFEEGVKQSGTITLAQRQEEGKPLSSDVFVNLAGNNRVGTMDSSTGSASFRHNGFNEMEGYNSQGSDTWVFVLTDEMLDSQNPDNALSKILAQKGNALTKIILDTSSLTKSYKGDIQVYSDNITLTTESVDYGEASGTYNQKDAVKNFSFVNPLTPELGDITINSLWTMVDAMDSFTSAIYGQLNFSPYRQTPRRNIWAKALYMNENMGHALPGYRKDSGGYAVGCDTAVGSKNILGIGFSQMLGTEMTNRGLGKDKQDIMMAMLYGRTILESCDKGATTLDYMLGYGYGDNQGKFFRTSGGNKYSTGNWDSNVFNAAVKATWYRKLNESFSLNPYVGGEFVFAEHEAHSIRGAAGDFEVGRSRVHALRIPIGATLEHKNTLSANSALTEYIGASYVPDVLRSNPSASVTNGMINQTVKDCSIGRNAVRGYVGTTWQINKDWLLNLHYEAEAASNKMNQTARAAVSYSF